MSTEKRVQELTQEAHMWFVLFLTFTGISLTAVAALVYLISTMLVSGNVSCHRGKPKREDLILNL